MADGNPQQTNGEPVTDGTLLQCRLAHLAMIQGVIGRMSGYSSSVKNFAVTIAAASLALALDKKIDEPLWIAIGATILLGILDTYYLHKEKGFRKAYDRMATNALDLKDANNLLIQPDEISFFLALRSISIWPFYLPLLITLGWLASRCPAS